MSVFEAEQKIEELLSAYTEMRHVRKYRVAVWGDHHDHVESASSRLDRARREVLEAMVRS